MGRLLYGLLYALALFSGPEKEEALLLFWNVENFFDWKADGASESELSFSEKGSRRWSKGRFYAKCQAIAQTILQAGDRFGRPPDLIGLAEVENRQVLLSLTRATLLRKLDYGIVHYDSPDRRGIDCALLYRKSRFRLISSHACPLRDSLGAVLPTRDILLSVLEPCTSRGGNIDAPALAVLVNHHPSKVGAGSDARRELAMERLRFLCDSLSRAGVSRIVAVGDFNDTVQPAAGVHVVGFLSGRGAGGTIKFQGKWEKIDGCPVLAGLSAEEWIFDADYLSERDSRYAGTKPRRTYSGPRYLGGVSDHYPVFYRLASPSTPD